MPRARLLHVLTPAPAAALLAAALLPVASPVVAANVPPAYVVCLDPGHGGVDPGALGLDGLVEKDLTLAVATRLETLLEADGVTVAMTRTGDSNPSIDQRSQTAQTSHADVFISIHFNAFISPQAEGSLILYPYARDIPFAQAMDQALAAYLQPQGAHDGGIELRNTEWLEPPEPTITVESLFVTNPHDAALLAQPDFLQGLAGAMRSGIEAFLPGILQRKQALAHGSPAATPAAGAKPASGHTAGAGDATAALGGRLSAATRAAAQAARGAAPGPGPPALLTVLLWLVLLGGTALAVRHRRRLARLLVPEPAAPARPAAPALDEAWPAWEDEPEVELGARPRPARPRTARR
jgi:N-acetylmuramoyl-L-alanine amidase